MDRQLAAHREQVWSRLILDSRAFEIIELDRNDFQLVGTFRRGNFGLFADPLAEQALAERARAQDPSLVIVFVAGADERIFLLVAEIDVLDGHGRAKANL